MNISVDENGTIRLKDVYNSVVFETDEGEELTVCMRDGAFEIALLDTGAKGGKYYSWYTANGEGVTPLLKTVFDKL